jgi:predicted molibdopterin-dependent oxidoreductase YjgC
MDLSTLDPIGRCFYCGCEIYEAKDIYNATDSNYPTEVAQMAAEDHVHPRSRGGSHKPENMVLACMICNSRKGDRTLEEYRKHLKHEQDERQAAEKLMEVANEFDLPESPALQRAAGRLLERASEITFHGEL